MPLSVPAATRAAREASRCRSGALIASTFALASSVDTPQSTDFFWDEPGIFRRGYAGRIPLRYDVCPLGRSFGIAG